MGLFVGHSRRDTDSCYGYPDDLIRSSIYFKFPGSMTITTHLNHISHCETASGTNWSNRWTYRVVIMNTGPDEVDDGTHVHARHQDGGYRAIMAHARQCHHGTYKTVKARNIRQSRPWSPCEFATPGYQAIMAHIRQAGEDSGVGFQVRVVKSVSVVPSSLGSGCPLACPHASGHPTSCTPNLLRCHSPA